MNARPFVRRETTEPKLNSWSADRKTSSHFSEAAWLALPYGIAFTGQEKLRLQLQLHTTNPSYLRLSDVGIFFLGLPGRSDVLARNDDNNQQFGYIGRVLYISKAPQILLGLIQLDIGTGSLSLAR